MQASSEFKQPLKALFLREMLKDPVYRLRPVFRACEADNFLKDPFIQIQSG
jgi:hypothetical protein